MDYKCVCVGVQNGDQIQYLQYTLAHFFVKKSKLFRV